MYLTDQAREFLMTEQVEVIEDGLPCSGFACGITRRALERDSRTRFEEMQEKAKNNPLKGKKGGDCNRTQCQKPGASSWNRGSRSWYCESCADLLNDANPMPAGEEPMVDSLPDFTYDTDGEFTIAKLAKAHGRDDDFQIMSSLGKPSPPYVRDKKVSRNEPCPCGSGNKFKKCCMPT